MIFGEQTDFAIEAEVESDLTPPSAVWGRMSVWCRGIRLGNFEETYCALNPSFAAFAWLSNHLDEIWYDELVGLDDQAAWNFLDGLLYGYHGEVKVEDGRTLDEMQADWNRYRKFNFLTNWGVQLDGYKSFILCPPNRPVRILSRRLPTSSGLSVQVSKRSILNASQEFVFWFNDQSRRLS